MIIFDLLPLINYPVKKLNRDFFPLSLSFNLLIFDIFQVVTGTIPKRIYYNYFSRTQEKLWLSKNTCRTTKYVQYICKRESSKKINAWARIQESSAQRKKKIHQREYVFSSWTYIWKSFKKGFFNNKYK